MVARYEKLKLIEVLRKETKQENDQIITHLASEKVLAKDWLLAEEDEAKFIKKDVVIQN